MEWISVEDRLPETTGSVLITNGDDVATGAYIKYVDGGGKWGRDSQGVTHWMPFPKPPKHRGE